MIRFVIVFVFLFVSIVGFSQNIEVPKVVDTVKSGDNKIVLFSDRTWQFVVNHDSVMAIVRALDSTETVAYILKNKIYAPDSATVFSEKWDTINIFAYGGINYKTVMDTFAIPLLRDTGKFVMPCLGRLQSPFGWRWGQMHNANDIELKTGDTLVSAFDGVVRFAGWNVGGYGYLVIIRHYNGLETYYAHLSKLICKTNQPIKAGEIIGLGGSTGRSYAPHVHFEVRYKDNAFDPQLMVDMETKQLKNDTLILTPANFGHIKEITEAQYHIVKSGDTLWGISKRYGVSIKYLCTLNGITEESTLNLGQKLRTR